MDRPQAFYPFHTQCSVDLLLYIALQPRNDSCKKCVLLVLPHSPTGKEEVSTLAVLPPIQYKAVAAFYFQRERGTIKSEEIHLLFDFYSERGTRLKRCIQDTGSEVYVIYWFHRERQGQALHDDICVVLFPCREGNN